MVERLGIKDSMYMRPPRMIYISYNETLLSLERPMNIETIVVLVAFAVLALVMLITFVVAVVRTFQEKPAIAPAMAEPTPEQVAAFDRYTTERMAWEERKSANIDRVLNSDNPL